MHFSISKFLYKYVQKTVSKKMAWVEELLLGKIKQCGEICDNTGE